MRRRLIFLVFAWLFAGGASAPGQEPRFPAKFGEAGAVLEALRKEEPAEKVPLHVSGVIVPHHLLAADLIARGVWAAANNPDGYERIIVLSPDHFKRSRRTIATTLRGFDTVLGPVEVDQRAVLTLLGSPDLAEPSDLFSEEHGIGAILPFLHHVFPDVPVVPVTLSIASSRGDWDRAAELLRTITTPRTLIVESTDFSHFLLPAVARSRDQETLNVLAAGDPAGVVTLNQPNHLDSKASLYIQMRLQREIFGSRLQVVANRNARHYTGQDAPSTSYIVGVFARETTAPALAHDGDQQIFFFGGDVFLGRGFTRPLISQAARRALVEQVRQVTLGSPLIVNLEGVLTPEPPTGVPADRHVMHDELAGPLLQAINVVAAGLANNHGFDLGADGLKLSAEALKRRGIQPLPFMKAVDMGQFRVIAINFVGANGGYRDYPILRMDDARESAAAMDGLCRAQLAPPVVALVHWGREYTAEGSGMERHIAEELARCGVNIVLGAHSHQASAHYETVAGGATVVLYSLGNFLFDQRSPRGSGALVELRLFDQGTYALRLVPVPNYFEFVTQKN